LNLEQIIGQLGAGVRVTFEQLLRDVLAPAHARGTWSQRWWGTLGAFAELFWQGAQEAADVGFAATCPGDALDEVGFSENIERLVNEANGPFRDRLGNPFESWEQSGTIDGIEDRFADLGLTGTAVYDFVEGWDPGDPNVYSYGRFWVAIEEPHPWEMLFAGDDVFASEELIAGVDGMTATDYRNLRRLVHKWRSGHSTPIAFYIIFNGPLGTLSTAAAEALVASEDATGLPITRPQASADIYASDNILAGWYIEPI
jgi:hypothetical protein